MRGRYATGWKWPEDTTAPHTSPTPDGSVTPLAAPGRNVEHSAERLYFRVPPMPPDLFEALLNPTAPLPASWPTGAWGAFLLFLFPIGGGIPTGVLVARAGGVSPPITALLYFFSDVIMAFPTEPMLIFLRWLGKRVPPIGRLGARLARFTGQTGLRDGGKRGPLGLILVSLTLDPTAGRAAAAAAGHGFVPGWTIAIIGDMIYFVLLMASTLWVSSVVGDDRVTLGAVLIAMWLVPF